MKKFSLFLILLMFTASLSVNAADNRTGRIKWLTNYDEAVQLSSKTSKPIILFFTGSDWCSWCMKLEDEALNTAEFADAAGEKFIFVKLDFPINRPLPADLTQQNKRLQKQFSVNGYPTIVVIDSQQHQIGTSGYRPGGGKQYAQQLIKMVDENSSYKQKVDSIDKQKFSNAELKQLYDRACTLGRASDLEKIVNVGLKSDQQSFFLLEKYRLLAAEGKNHTPEAQTIKQQLMNADPTNIRLTSYQIAVIDFDAIVSNANKWSQSPEQIVAPLVEYCQKYGDQDKTNLWRLQMIIAQVFLDKNKLPQALQYAQSSLRYAPTTVKPDIALAIQNIHSQLEK